jgi:hypothetical protein
MAFNPFSSFRKYQKYWMAGAVLVCMFTFVLCSGGIRGTGLDDLIFRWFPGRRGEYLVKVNNRKYFYEDMTQLKQQRKIANDYLVELMRIGVKRLTTNIQELKSATDLNPNDRFLLGIREVCLDDLFTRLNRDTRYFSGGTKLDELIDFIVWRDLADKYGVNVTDELVKEFVRNACHGKWWGYDDSDADLQAQFNIRGQHAGADGAAIRAALMQEFRVQIMQLAYIERWSPGPNNEREKYANYPLGKDGPFLHLYLNTPMQPRVAPSPEQISSQFGKKRTELTIDLLPVSLEELAAKVKLPEDRQARLEILKRFYDENARKSYNPNLDTPGFLFPARAEIQFLTADAGMPYYKEPAHVMSVLEKTPPLAFNPACPLLGVVTWKTAEPAWQSSLQRSLDAERGKAETAANNQYLVLAALKERYLTEKEEKEKESIKLAYETRLSYPPAPYKNSASPLTTPYYYSPGQYELALEKPGADPATKDLSRAGIAGLIGGAGELPLTGLLAFQGAAYEAQGKKIADLAPHAVGKRIEAGAELFLAQTPQFFGDGAFTAAGLTYYAGLKPQFLPIAGYIEKELTSKIEEELAQHWVNTVMLDVKKQLEFVKNRGEEAFDRQVNDLRNKYSVEVVDANGKKKVIRGLQYGETSQLRNEYDVEYDEGLKPLRESFDKYRTVVNQIEGRDGKSDMLREGDFSKIFFGTEPLGIGAQEPFTPRVWPPYVTVPKWRASPLAQKSLEQRLFDTATKPIVFWKSVKRAAEPLEWRPDDPKMIAFVEKQYRLQEARANLMPEVKKIADELKRAQQSEGKDLPQTMRELAKKHGTSVVTLDKVAMLIENPDRRAADPMSFVEYALPRNRIPFARPDMVKMLLSLRGLQEPLKINTEESEKSGKTGGTEVAVSSRAKQELEELNKLNAELYSSDIAKNPKAKVGQIQVLTNKPHDMFYIATVVDAVQPSAYGYLLQDLTPQLAGRDNSQFAFAEQVQQDFGKELVRILTQQMRSQADVDVSEQGRKQFADEAQGQ